MIPSPTPLVLFKYCLLSTLGHFQLYLGYNWDACAGPAAAVTPSKSISASLLHLLRFIHTYTQRREKPRGRGRRGEQGQGRSAPETDREGDGLRAGREREGETGNRPPVLSFSLELNTSSQIFCSIFKSMPAIDRCVGFGILHQGCFAA
jgi:hypothetical protein